MTAEQITDALELLANTVVKLSKKKELKDYFEKNTIESINMLEDALRRSRKERKRSNAWLKD